MKLQAGIVDYAIYENGSEYLGTARITLPDMQKKTLTVNGAGVLGDVEIPVPGQTNAMSCTIEFTDNPEAVYKLSEERVHILDCRVAHEIVDSKTQSLKALGYKHILTVLPKTHTSGTVAPATAQGASCEFSVLAIKTYCDNKCVLEHDPLNYKSVGADGADNLKDIRKILGKR